MKSYAYRATAAGIARRASERGQPTAAIEAVEAERAPVVVPVASSNVVRLVIPRTEAQTIIAEVAHKHGLTFADIMRKTLARNIVAARDEAMTAVKTAKPEMSNSQLGRMFAGMKRPGVIAALRRQRGRLA